MVSRLVSYWKCFWSIWRHKYHVWQGARLVGGIPFWRILGHDLVKFHPKEFFGYANKFYGANDDQDLFDMAWLHHQNSQDHHWNFWLSRGGHRKQGTETITTRQGLVMVMPMPEVCVREMVADWIGASIVYSDTTDMTDWLRENLSRIHVHPETGRLVTEILVNLGYSEARAWW